MTDNTSHRELGRAVFLAAIMLLSVVSMSAALTGGVAAQESTLDGTRTVEDTTLSPGESTNVTTEVTLDSSGDVNLIDQFSPAFENVRVVSVSDNADFDGASASEVFAQASGLDAGSTVSITYEVTVPSDAGGQSFEISSDTDGGNVDARSDTINVIGEGTLVGDRTLEATELEPGQSTNVTTTVTLDSSGDVNLIDQFSPAFESVEVQSVSDNADFDGASASEAFAQASGLDAGSTVSITYEVTAPSGSDTIGNTHEISSDTEGGNVQAGTDTIDIVEDATVPATFEVSNLDPETATVNPGDSLTVSADIENTGDEAGTQTVAFQVDGSDLATQQVQLDAGANTTVSFDVNAPSQTGEYTHAIASEDDTAEGTLTVEEEPAEGSLEFAQQATFSTTFTTADGELTAPGVVVSNVSATVDSAVVVTYENDAGDLIIAGLTAANASDLNGNPVVVPIEDAGGFAGAHTAHVIPQEDLSSSYAPGDAVSSETAGAILDNEQATVYQSFIDFQDQTFQGETGELTVSATLSPEASGTLFTVDVHPTDEDGNLIAPQYVGSTNVLEAGSNEDVTVDLQDSEGNDVTFEPGTSDDYIAMIHIVDDDASAGDPATPGEYGVLPHVSANGVVPGGVTDDATITVEESGPPALPGQDSAPTDTDGDGQFEDIDGDGELTIFDIRALFNNLNSDVVQNNQQFFNFDGENGVDIFDVRALFNEFQSQG